MPAASGRNGNVPSLAPSGAGLDGDRTNLLNVLASAGPRPIGRKRSDEAGGARSSQSACQSWKRWPPDVLRTQLKASIDKWMPAVKAAGIEPE